MSTLTRKVRPLTPRRAHRQPKPFETLESRVLLTATTVGFQLSDFQSLAGTYDGSGRLWFANAATDPNSFVAAQSIVQIATSGSNTGSVINTLDVSSAANPDSNFTAAVVPTSLVYNPVNGHLYFIDADYSQANYSASGTSDSGSIVEVDPNYIQDNLPTPVVAVHTLPEDGQPRNWTETPLQLTVSGDGSVWFAAAGNPDLLNNNVVAAVGRLDLSGNITFQTFSSVHDATAISVAANGPDSVWVGLRGIITEDLSGNGVIGQSHIGAAHWDGTQIVTDAVYNINTGDPAAPTGTLNSVATDPIDHSVWFTLANGQSPFNPDPRSPSQIPPDQIVNGILDNSGNLVQTAYIVNPSNPTTALGVQSLAVDSSDRVWFVENLGNNVDMLDSSNGSITRLGLPDGTTAPQAVVPASDGSQAWVVNGFAGTGDPLVEVVNPINITFSGSGASLTNAEDVSLGNNVQIATFVAPANSYQASINWGDGTNPTVVTPWDLGPAVGGGEQYEVLVSGKIYNTPGTYSGTVTVSTVADPTTSVGTIGFTATITDTPLNLTSMNVISLGRIAIATATFTDDVDSTTSMFSASISWGDNTSSNGMIVRDPTHPGQYIILAIHVYRARGTYTVTTNVSTTEPDAVLGTTSLSKVITVR